MVKVKQTRDVGMVAEGTIPSQFTFPGGFHIPTDNVDVGKLADIAAAMGMTTKGLVYCIQYGLSQSGQDCVAGLAKELDSAKWVEADVEAGKCAPGDVGEPRYSAVEKATIMHDAYKARFDTILAGEIGHRAQGPRVKGLERVMHEIAWEIIVAKAQSLGVAAKLPKKASEIAGMVTGYLAVADNAANVKVEAEDRMAKAAKAADGASDFLKSMGLTA